MKEIHEIVTAKDLPAINRILSRGDQVILVPVKGGKRGYRIRRDEIDFPMQAENENKPGNTCN